MSLECAQISWHSPGVLLVEFAEGATIEQAEARSVVARGKQVVEDRPHTILIDARKLRYVSSEARNHFAAQSSAQLLGTALVISSQLQAGLANLYLNVSRPVVPTRVFTEEVTALAFLRERLTVGRKSLAP